MKIAEEIIKALEGSELEDMIGKSCDTKEGRGTITGYNGGFLIVDLDDGGTIEVTMDNIKNIS